MLKKKNVFYMMVSLLIIIWVFTGCDISGPIEETPESGILFISLSDGGVESRTLLPELSMDITTYRITGIGPDEESFSETVSGADYFLQDDLVTGSWTINVDAYNDEVIPVRIGTGSQAVTIKAAQVTESVVEVLPIEGTGRFELTIDWDVMLDDPSLEFSLVNSDKEMEFLSETFSISGQEGVLVIPELGNGYYLMNVVLKDGETSLGYAIETLRIVSDTTTAGQLAVITNATGELNLIINEEMDDPIIVSLSEISEQVAIGTELTVTAETSEEVESYDWYLNGIQFIGETSDSISFGSELAEGDYQLTCVVWKGNVICSSRIDFTIIDPETTYAIGDIGPAGGRIFYDDAEGFDLDGSGTIETYEKDLLDGNNDGVLTAERYLEVAPSGWYDTDEDGFYGEDDDPQFQWGRYGYEEYTIVTLTGIGTGLINTEYIVNYHDLLGTSYPEIGDYYTHADSYNYQSDGSVAAKACHDAVINEFDDWFMPSRDEMDALYGQLAIVYPDEFQSGYYWSSSESNYCRSYSQYFSTGYQYTDRKFKSQYVRPIRAF